MKDVFISAYHGGLGDSLQFSTLPELYAGRGHDVYVWESAYFRNDEIRDLVWGLNPYVKGTKAGEWNAGDIPGSKYENIAGNVISNWEVLHGFPPTNRYPKIYYTPKHDVRVDGTILLDLTSISGDYREYDLTPMVADLVNRYPNKDVYQVTFRKSLNNAPQLDKIKGPWENPNMRRFLSNDFDSKKLEINNIFEYCDVIASCDVFITLHSGGHALSSAIKQDNEALKIHSIINRHDYDLCTNKGAFFLFENIEYSVLEK